MNEIDTKGIGFFGTIVVDRVLSVQSWPQESTLGLIEGRELLGTGGSAWNDPVNVRAIDPDVPLSVCGVVGSDAMGEFVLTHLRERGIDVSQVEVVDDADTSYSIVANSRSSGLRTHLHATGACDRFGCVHIEAFPFRLAIAHLGYLMLLKALEQQEDGELQAVRALRSLGEKADKVAVDIVSLDNSAVRFRELVIPCLPHIDYLIINEFEAEQITGSEIRKGDDTIDGAACIAAARELRARGVRDTVIIHFPEGPGDGSWDGRVQPFLRGRARGNRLRGRSGRCFHRRCALRVLSRPLATRMPVAGQCQCAAQHRQQFLHGRSRLPGNSRRHHRQRADARARVDTRAVYKLREVSLPHVRAGGSRRRSG